MITCKNLSSVPRKILRFVNILYLLNKIIKYFQLLLDGSRLGLYYLSKDTESVMFVQNERKKRSPFNVELMED